MHAAFIFDLLLRKAVRRGLRVSRGRMESSFWARNRYAIRLADHQRSAPGFVGWDRMGEGGYSLYPGNLLITCRFLVIFLGISRKKRNFAAEC